MSTDEIAEELDELRDEIHTFDYGRGPTLTHLLRKIVDTMGEINDHLASLRTDFTDSKTSKPKGKKP